MWKLPAFAFAFAGVVLLVSLPEVPSQIRALAEALGVTGAEWHWWNYAGVLLGLFIMLLTSYPAWKWVTKNARIRIEPPPTPRDIIILIAMAVAIVGIIFLFLTTEWSKPIYAWAHSTMALSDQVIANAECRMQAFDSIGGSSHPSRYGARNEYISACLTSKGFALKKVEGNQS